MVDRQRLAIARASLRQGPILLLDEPTVGLDSASEAAVLAAVPPPDRETPDCD